MNRILKSGLLFMLLIGMMSVSCKKEYDIPPIPQLPFGDTLTITQILAMPTEVPFESASVCGIVTADEQSGNLYKMIFIQDRLTGKGIELVMNTSSAARIGDSVRVYLDSTMIAFQNHGLSQLTGLQGKGFNPDGHLVIYPYNKPIEPKTVTIADIKSGQYLASLVRLENVEFTQSGTFADAGGSGNRFVVDPTSPTEDQNFIVRTSNYANFAYDNLPQGPGSMVAIATIYNSTWQLIIRSKSEMRFENWDPTPSTPEGEVQNLPYTQSFASGFGTYMSYSVLDDDHTWTFESSYSIVQMTAHIQEGQQHYYYENEDWLISSPVAVTGVSDAKMTMRYLGRYFDNINNDVTVWVSSNYTYGENPTTAQWTQLPANLSESSSWSDFKDVELALTEFVGQTINVAVKYTSTYSKAGTIEVASIIVEEGLAGDTPTPPIPPTPVDGEGSGTADDPYNVAAGIENQCWECNSQNATDAPIAWVSGYIVGVVKNGTTSVTSNSDIIWNGTFDSQTNVVIADDPTCNEVGLCIVVNLPSGKPLRSQVNLVDNPENLGKALAVYGRLRPYFGQAGLRDSNGTENDFVLEGGVTPPPAGQEIFSENFGSGQGNFTIQDVTLPEELTYVWQHDANYSCMKASAYVGQAYAAESWLVSPAIDLSGVSSATLKFDQAVNYASPQGALTVMVSTDFRDDVLQATWTELNLSQWPAGSNWTFINSTADLSQYAGQTVTIAFKYTSTSSSSATWEVKNFVVEE